MCKYTYVHTNRDDVRDQVNPIGRLQNDAERQDFDSSVAGVGQQSVSTGHAEPQHIPRRSDPRPPHAQRLQRPGRRAHANTRYLGHGSTSNVLLQQAHIQVQSEVCMFIAFLQSRHSNNKFLFFNLLVNFRHLFSKRRLKSDFKFCCRRHLPSVAFVEAMQCKTASSELAPVPVCMLNGNESSCMAVLRK